MWNRFIDWAVHSEGSSRTSALLRMGLVLLVWSRWAREAAPFYNPELLFPRVILSLALAVGGGMLFVGLWTRFSAPFLATATMAMYAHGVFTDSSWKSHHTYILALALCYCALTPCGRSYSVDRWLAVRRARRQGAAAPPERGNLLGLRLMALQAAVLYFFTAIDKTYWGYFNGVRVESILMTYYSGSVYPDWPGFHAACVVLGIATVVLEYALAVGLFFPSARRILMPLGVLFHVGLYFALPVLTFSLTMILLYLAFFDPDDVHRVIDELQAT